MHSDSEPQVELPMRNLDSVVVVVAADAAAVAAEAADIELAAVVAAWAEL